MTFPIRSARRLAWLGVLGAGLACIADLLLLYHRQGGYEDPSMGFIADISLERLYAGVFLGVAAIPLEAGAFALIWKGLEPGGKKTARIAVFLGIYLIAIGTATHALFFPVGTAQAQGVQQVMEAKAVLEPIATAFVIGFFLLFGVLSFLIFKGKTRLPRWATWTTPLFSYLIIVLLYLTWPGPGNVLMPAAFNFALLVFYLVLIQSSRNWE